MEFKPKIRIFLCHSKGDEGFVQKLYHQLLQSGYRPWMPQNDVFPGEDEGKAISQAIRECDFFVPIISENFLHERGRIQTQLRESATVSAEYLADDIYRIPIRIQDVNLPDDIQNLRPVDWFVEWQQDNFFRALEEGIERRKLRKSDTAGVSHPALSPIDTPKEGQLQATDLDIWPHIADTERQLRSIVTHKMHESHGEDWESRIHSRYPDLVAKWKKAQDDSKEQESYYRSGNALLDYSTLGELGNLILAEWQSFNSILTFLGDKRGKENKKRFEEYIQDIAKVRNAYAHNRNIHQHFIRKAWVACDEIRLSIASGLAGVSVSSRPATTKEHPLTDSRSATATEPIPDVVISYCRTLIDHFRVELVREQYEILGIAPEEEILPIAWIQDTLIGTTLRELSFSQNGLRFAGEAILLNQILGRPATRLVLVGEPGAGKTTLLKRLAVYLASKKIYNDPGKKIPIYLSLVDFGPFSLMDEIIAAVNQFGYSETKESLTDRLNQGEFILLLDGLNEVAVENYARCRAEINFLIKLYPKNDYVITDRPTYDGTLQAPVYSLVDWGEDQVALYVQEALRRLESRHPAEGLLSHLKTDLTGLRLVGNPLLLGLVTREYSDTGNFSSNLANLYLAFVQRVFARDKVRQPNDLLDPETKERLLSRLALHIRGQEKESITETEVKEFIGEILVDLRRNALVGVDVNASNALEGLKRGRMLRETGVRGQLRFNFEFLMEIFSAIGLKKEMETRGVDLLVPYITNARWENTITLLAGLLGRDASPLIQKVFDLAGVHFAARCLISAPQVAVREKILQSLRRELFSVHIYRRIRTPALFVHLRDQDAILDLVKALEDTEGKVRWDAALAIQRTIGEGPSDEIFIRLLEDSELTDDIKNSACIALGRSASKDAESALIRALDNPSEFVRRQAARALGKINSPAVKTLLLSALNDESDRVIAGALKVLGLLRSPDLKDVFEKYVDHSDADIQTEARLALAMMGDEDVINAVIDQIENERNRSKRKAVHVHKAIYILDEAGVSSERAVDALWDCLSNSFYRTAVARVLSRIKSGRVNERIQQSLESTDVSKRREALSILNQKADVRWIPTLCKVLRDVDVSVRNMAVLCLSQFQFEATPYLEEILVEQPGEGMEDIQKAALRTLRNINNRLSIQILARSINHSSPEVARAALRFLRECDFRFTREVVHDVWSTLDPRIQEDLESLLGNLETSRHSELTREFLHYQEPRLLQAIIQDCDSDIEIVRRSAVIHLGKSKSSQAVPVLERLIQTGNIPLTTVAISSLIRIGMDPSGESLEKIRELLRSDSSPQDLKATCAEALGLFGSETDSNLLWELNEKLNPESKLARAYSSALFRLERYIREGREAQRPATDVEWELETLAERLKSPRSYERQMVIQEIKQFEARGATDLLIKALNDRSGAVRHAAVLALGERGSIAAISDLHKMLDDENPHLRRATILALHAIGTSGAYQALEKVSRDRNIDLRLLAIRLLSRNLGDLDAFKSLIMFLNEPNDTIRAEIIRTVSEDNRIIFSTELYGLLQSALKHPNPYVRSATLIIIGNLSLVNPMVEDVCDCASHVNYFVRLEALKALSRSDTERAVRTLAEALQDHNNNIRLTAAQSLIVLDSDWSMRELKLLAVDRVEDISMMGLQAGIKSNQPAAIELIGAYLMHVSEEVRLKALDAFRKKAGSQHGLLLIPVIQDKRRAYRQSQHTAIKVAGEIQAEGVVDLLIKHLEIQSPNLQKTIVTALGNIRNPQASPHLVNLITESNIREVRCEALRALGCLGDHEGIQGVLAGFLQDKDPYVRSEAARSLGRIQPDLVDDNTFAVMIQITQNRRESRYVLYSVIESLAKIGNVKTIAALKAMLTHWEKMVRIKVVETLGTIADTDSKIARTLVQGVKRESEQKVLETYFEVFSKIGGSIAAIGLEFFLQQGDDVRRVKTIDALKNNGSAKAISILTSIMTWGEEAQRLAAIEALGELKVTSPIILRRLLGALRRIGTEGNAIGEAAEQALMKIGIYTIADEIIALLNYKNPHIQQAACRLLGSNEVSKAVKPLTRLLSSKNNFTRRAAAKALQQIASEESLMEVVPLLTDQDWRVRTSAAIAIGEMQYKPAVPLLENLLEDEILSPRLAAISALGLIKTVASLEALQLATLDPDYRVRDQVLKTITDVLKDQLTKDESAQPDKVLLKSSISLLRLLLNDRRPGFRRGILEVLVSIPGDGIIPTLLQCTLDVDAGVKIKAIRELGSRRVLTALDLLMGVRYDHSREVRQEANEAIDRVKEHYLNRLFEKATRRGKHILDWHSIRQEHMDDLEKVGSVWLARRITFLYGKTKEKVPFEQWHPRARNEAETIETYVRLLGWTGQRLGQDVIREQMETRSTAILAAAIEAAGYMKLADYDKDLLNLIVDYVANRKKVRHDSVRLAATRALGHMAAKDYVSLIKRLCRDENSFVRDAAIATLIELNAKDAERELLSVLNDETEVSPVRQKAIAAIGALNIKSGMDHLIAALDSPVSNERRIAIKTLAALNHTEAASAIINMFDDKDVGVVLAAIEACTQMGLKDAVASLVKIRMHNQNWQLMHAASRALASIRSETAIDLLAPYTQKEDEKQQRTAIRALARIDLPEACEQLESLFNQSEDQKTLLIILDAIVEIPDESRRERLLRPALLNRDDVVRRNALLKLRVAGNVENLQEIIESLLSDPSDQVRAAAANALESYDNELAVQALIQSLRREETPYVKQSMANALAIIGSSVAMDHLNLLRQGQDNEARLIAIKAVQQKKLHEALSENLSKKPREFLFVNNTYKQQEAIRQVATKGMVECVPDLLQLLVDEKSNIYTLRVVVDALGKLGTAEITEAFLPLAHSEDQLLREMICKALGEIGDGRCVETLVMLTTDPVPEVSNAAYVALARFESPQTLSIISEALQTGSPKQVDFITKSVINTPYKLTVGCLIKALENEDENSRLAMLQHVSRLEMGVALSALRIAIHDKSALVINRTLKLIGLLGLTEPDLIEDVKKQVTSGNSFNRAEAVKTLGILRFPDSLDLLIHALSDPVVNVVEESINALGELADIRSIEPLETLLEHSNIQVVRLTVNALSKIKATEAATALGMAMDHRHGFVREDVVKAISNFSPDISIPYLVDALKDANAYVREQAVLQLGETGRAEVCSPVSELLDDPNAHVRSAAATVLRNIRCISSLPRLVRQIDDENSFVRTSVISSIGNLSGGEFQTRLMECLGDSNPNVRMATIEALARKPSAGWYRVVAEMAVNDPMEAVRSKAFKAIEAIHTLESSYYVQGIQEKREKMREFFRTAEYKEIQRRLEEYAEHGFPGNPDLDEPLFAELTQWLLHEFSFLRLKVATVIERHITDTLLPLCKIILQDPVPDIRRAGARAIARLGSGPSLEMAIQVLESDDDPGVRDGLIRNLESNMAADSIWLVLMKALEDEDRIIVQSAIRVLARMDARKAIPLIQPALNHHSDFVREAAVNALGRLQAVEAIPEMKKRLEPEVESSWYVRQDTVTSLARMNDAQLLLQICSTALKDPNLYVNMSAAQVLQEHVDPWMFGLLMETIGHPNAAIRSIGLQAISALLSTYPDVTRDQHNDIFRELLDRFTREVDQTCKIQLFDVLCMVNGRQTVNDLWQLAFDSRTALRRKVLAFIEDHSAYLPFDPFNQHAESIFSSLPLMVRRDILNFANHVGPGKFRKILILATRDRDEIIRSHVAYGIGGIAEVGMVTHLVRLLHDPVKRVRETAYRSLQFIYNNSRHASPDGASQREQQSGAPGFVDPMTNLVAWLQSDHNINISPQDQENIKREFTWTIGDILFQARSENRFDRLGAVIAMRDHRSDETTLTLLDMYLFDENKSVQKEVINSLRLLPPAMTKRCIQRKLDDHEIGQSPEFRSKMENLLVLLDERMSSTVEDDPSTSVGESTSRALQLRDQE